GGHSQDHKRVKEADFVRHLIHVWLSICVKTRGRMDVGHGRFRQRIKAMSRRYAARLNRGVYGPENASSALVRSIVMQTRDAVCMDRKAYFSFKTRPCHPQLHWLSARRRYWRAPATTPAL